MKKTNNLIPIRKEESCQIFGGIGNRIAEGIGRGVGRFARGFCNLWLAMAKYQDFVWYR